jgi:hypothetical protein
VKEGPVKTDKDRPERRMGARALAMCLAARADGAAALEGNEAGRDLEEGEGRAVKSGEGRGRIDAAEPVREVARLNIAGM